MKKLWLALLLLCGFFCILAVLFYNPIPSDNEQTENSPAKNPAPKGGTEAISSRLLPKPSSEKQEKKLPSSRKALPSPAPSTQSNEEVLQSLFSQGTVQKLLEAMQECKTLECIKNLSQNLLSLGLTPQQMKLFLQKISDHPQLYLLTAYSIFDLYQKGKDPGWELLLLNEILPTLPRYLHFESIKPEIAELAMDVLNEYTHFFRDHKEILPLLIQTFSLAALQSEDPDIRGNATISLGNLAEPAALKTLEAVLRHDKDPQVHSFALWSLGNFPKYQVEPLFPLLEKEMEQGDINATVTLSKFGVLKAMKGGIALLPSYSHDEYQGTIGTGGILAGFSSLTGLEKEDLYKQVNEALQDASREKTVTDRDGKIFEVKPDPLLQYNLGVIKSRFDLNETSKEELEKLLWKGLQDPQVQDRLSYELTFSLAHLHDLRILPYLEKLKDSKIPSVQRQALLYLQQFKK